MGERRSASIHWSAERARNDIQVKVVWEAIQRIEATAESLDESMCRFCTRCSKTANKVCEGCREAHYCSRRCQKKDWHIHRNDCKKISIVVTTATGETLALQNLPLRTSVHDIRKKVHRWACAMMAGTRIEILHDDDFSFDLKYADRILFNRSITLAKLMIKDGEELTLIGWCEGPPPLIDSSSSGHEW